MPALLDLFCGAGGAAMGYYRAGFDTIVGVDVKQQPHYPFEFVQGDALEVLASAGHGFDAIHASPPCQASSVLRFLRPDRKYPELIPSTRAALRASGLPYVIENVVGAKLINPTMLCGTTFGLGVRRHRLFETSFPLMAGGCVHGRQRAPVPVYGHTGAGANRGRERARGRANTVAEWAVAMGIDWMTAAEMAQAIPPAFTEHVGEYLLQATRVGGGDPLGRS